MKRKTYLSLFAAAVCLVFANCQKPSSGVQEVLTPVWGPLGIAPAEDIMNKIDVNLYVPDEKRMIVESGQSIKKGSQYWIRFSSHYSSLPFEMEGFSEERKKYEHFMMEIGTHIISYLEKHPLASFDGYYYAEVKGEARIFADKELFHRDAGSNLSDLMLLYLPHGSKIAATYPDFRFVQFYDTETTPVTFADYFRDGFALALPPAWFALRATFVEQPSEEYDEITFTIEIPIECEYMQQIIFGEDYPESYYEEGLVERNENRVLKGSVTIKFDE